MPTRTIVIAGTHSGCGKTTASLALMAALVRRGFTVQAFKAGPDFIDPGHHEAVTGRPSHNLDGWMMGEAGVREVFSRYAADADVAVVEGVMGLFDGFSGSSEEGTTAQLAKWLDAPVVLVVDARSMARSAAAMVKGYAEFDPELNMAGVLFNRIGSDNHKSIIEEAMLDLPGILPLGFLARNEKLALPSRHLGLVTAEDHKLDDEMGGRLARWMEDGANLGRLLSLAPDPALTLPEESTTESTPPQAPDVRIGVARDRAFCFYYHENLRLLAEAGAELVPFSPLIDTALPADLDGLYLGGGYPELHAETLSTNAGMLSALRSFCASNKPVYAECGGFMTLMQSITDATGHRHPMAGVFPMNAAMGDRFRALGYREAVTTADSAFGPAWTMLRGHEFHYSSLTDMGDGAEAVYKVRDRKGWTDLREGFTVGRTLGTYVHAHFISNPDVPAAFVQACRDSRNAQGPTDEPDALPRSPDVS
ncbi:cobyrinate a,c-diamide synthase [Desulfovibrio ferrophilus]|uniref:Cobyrinate a,c-diamide synthase n=1 Tax=Desulfovibrio ferrophilus TaxID=241368 RepID=A0A2Z6B2L9_9BACT|nr:cobyrinate a,c-diamide synthase [Desulfovibrio ferrophilus]BBD09703.1 cobyrinic acid A,C-diamide synthase [Desulfovibrio ferrophilus]